MKHDEAKNLINKTFPNPRPFLGKSLSVASPPSPAWKALYWKRLFTDSKNEWKSTTNNKNTPRRKNADVIFPPFRINQIVSIFRNRSIAKSLRRPKFRRIDAMRKLNHHMITIASVDGGALCAAELAAHWLNLIIAEVRRKAWIESHTNEKANYPWKCRNSERSHADRVFISPTSSAFAKDTTTSPNLLRLCRTKILGK